MDARVIGFESRRTKKNGVDCPPRHPTDVIPAEPKGDTPMRSAEEYRNAIQRQMAETGPPAVRMLGGQPLSPEVVFHALGAAGLLDEATAGPERSLRREVLDTAAGAPQVVIQVVFSIDLRPQTIDFSDADPAVLEGQLDRLLLIAGLLRGVPESCRVVLQDVIHRNVLDIDLDPNRFRPLIPAAELRATALDLPSSHPGAELLQAIEDAKKTPALSETGFRAVLLAVGRRLFPTVPEWMRRRPELATWMEGQLQRTSVGFAADSAVIADIGQPFVLDRREREEVSLIVAGSEAILVWVGDLDAPQRAWSGSALRELTRAESPLPGTVAFRLMDEEHQEWVTLEWPDRTWRVRLYDSNP